MRYITYEEYLTIGGTLDLTAFERNITRVCSIIDTATFCRIEVMHKVPEEVKALCRDLLEYFAVHSVTETVVTSRSQSAGNVSESESYLIKTKEDQARDIDDMVIDYLSCVENDKGIPLLYRGCKE